MFFTTRPRLLWLGFTLGSLILSANTAFEKAVKHEGGSYSVDNLLIACTTNPEAQKSLANRYTPHCAHDHRASEWVSFDMDPELAPDIVASIEHIDKHIKDISGRVYIEHLNDCSNEPLCSTYQGELLRKLTLIMKPGAKLYMDFFPAFGLNTDKGAGTYYFDHSNSPYGISDRNGVDSRKNPFWAVASKDHFLQAVQPGSHLDTFGGRAELLAHIVGELRHSPEYMAEVPGRFRAEPELTTYLKAGAAATLAEAVSVGYTPSLEIYAQAFYGAKLQKDIVRFLTSLGFEGVRTVRMKNNPFNGRPNEVLIVATQAETKSGPAEAGVPDRHPSKAASLDSREEIKTPAKAEGVGAVVPAGS
jgi:hypothetical protein